MYPRININLNKLKHNIDTLHERLSFLDEIYIITKSFCAYPPVVNSIVSWGYSKFGDSRVQNLQSIKENHPEVQTLLVRIPMLCEIEQVIKYANRSLNSELVTIQALNEEAIKQGKVHEIILMIDLGDLREGIMYDSDYLAFVGEIINLPNIKLVGVGTNLTCYGGVIPSVEQLQLLVDIKEAIEKEYNVTLEVVSGGNSSSLELALDGGLPKGITNLRIGDAFISGMETANGYIVQGLEQNIFTLEAQVIEAKDKPSLPIGNIGVNAFGEKVEFEDVGIHRRLIMGIGRQDVSADDLYRPNERVKLLGTSSDHMLLEAKDKNIKVGDILEFNMDYGGILSLMTSPYVYKNIIEVTK